MALTRLISDYKESVKVATTGNITLVGGAPNVVDGLSLSLNDRVLVWKQNDPTENGIYRVSILGTGANGTWVRAADFDDYRKITSGALTFVEQGSINGNVYFYVPGGEPNVTVGSTSIPFSNLYAGIFGGYTSTTNSFTFANTTQSTSSSTGSLVVTGGVGIGGNLYIGGNLVVTGNTTFLNSEVVQVTEYAGNLIANSGVASTSKTTGALQVQGGAGITGNLYVANIYVDNITVGGSSAFLRHTTSTTPPNNPAIGDTWYNTTTDILYEYIKDAANNTIWIDITNQPNSFANLVVTNTATIGNVSATTVNYSQLVQNGINKNAQVYTSSVSAPSNPNVGDQWYDQSTDSLYTYFTDGISSFWLDISDKSNFVKFTTSATAPQNPNVGDQWYDNSTDTLYTRISDGTSSYWLDILNFPEAILYNATNNSPSTARPGDQWYDTSADVLYTRVSDGVSSYWVDLYTRFPSSNLTNGGTSVGLSYNGPITDTIAGANIFSVNQNGTITNGLQTINGSQIVALNQTITGSQSINGSQSIVGNQTTTGSIFVGNNIIFNDTTSFNTANSLGMRNRIINGVMQIWQRGTSFSGVSGNGYTADRWTCSLAGITANITQSTDVPSIQYPYSLKLAPTGSGTATEFVLRQWIEQVNVYDFAGQSVTASAWVKSSTSSVKIRVLPYNSTGGTDISQTFTVTPNVWTKITGVFASFSTVTAWPGLSSNAGAIIDIGFLNNASLTANDYVLLTGVQLEAGTVATPFERRSYGYELALCQRYYQTITAFQSSNGYWNSYYGGSAAVMPQSNIPITMRTTPTVGCLNSGVEYYSFAGVWTATTITGTGTNTNTIVATCPSDGDGRGKLLRTGSSGTLPLPILTLSAEL